MITYFAVAGVLGILLILSAKTELPDTMQRTGWKKPFLKAAWLMVQKRGDIPAAERLGEAFLVLFAGLGVVLLAQVLVTGQHNLINGYELNRPDKGQRVQELQVQIENEDETEQLEIVLGERKYSPAEKQMFLKEAMEEIETVLLGENVSADEVRGQVVLPEQAADGKVSVLWTQMPSGLLEGDGTITEDLSEEGELLQLRADLECSGENAVYECVLRLMPQIYTAEEQLNRLLQKSVREADERSAQDKVVKLPREVDGRGIVWKEPETSVLESGIGLVLAAAAAIWAAKSREQQAEKEKRRRQLLIDYPTLLFKLSMLLNAGLTMQNAFVKIALEYREHRGRTRFAYEEMLVSYYEMQSGVSEARAYENFGRRCGEAGYVKLGTMLSGNLQKGSEGLAALLQEEALYSMEERRQMAKKLGEEAGTKLLLPMLLMLIVVLIIMMVPAVMAF